jgi:hypothetical protein
MKFNRLISPAVLFLILGSGARIYAQHETEEKHDKPQKPAAAEKPQQRAEPRPQNAPPAKQQEQRAQQPKQPAQPQRAEPTNRAQSPQPAPQSARQPAPQAAQQPAQRQPQAQSTNPAQHQPAAGQGRNDGQKANYTPPLRTRQQAKTWQQQSSWRQGGAWQGQASWQQDRSSNWQSDHRTWSQRGGYGGYYIPQDSFSLHFGVGNWFRIQSQPVIVGGYPRFQYGGYSFLMVDPWPADWAENWYAADDVYVGYDNGYYLYNRQYPGEAIAVTVLL